MSSIAIAHELPRRKEKNVLPRRGRAPRGLKALLPWKDVSLYAPGHHTQQRMFPVYGWGLAAAAIAIHGLIIWLASHSVYTPTAPPKHELAVEFATPPKPPEPRIEPPKPPPPKPQVTKQAQVLPQIQQAAPDSSNVPAVSSEPPVPVAPIVSAPPVPAPEPVTAAYGRAGYLNNPEPSYPAMAARQGWQGTVLLRVHVQSNGKPDVVEVQRSSGHKALDDEAVRTVLTSWTYSPAKRGSTPIDGWTTTPIEFRIDG